MKELTIEEKAKAYDEALERTNILAKSLIPKLDEEFKTKFKQLLNETKQRLQKEFDEL